MKTLKMENEARRADISTEEIEDFFEKSKGRDPEFARWFLPGLLQHACLLLSLTSKTRQVAKQEKLKACPPRLRKHKFQPAPVQVLLSEEINGSIRKLKGCCTLLKDRYKNIEKRGLIVPKTNRNRIV
ncbi:ribosome biogenesis protein NOP53 [Trifolium repens]|nr:ribosome biogenesis protein NOP53 [Trifolium repens]